MVGFFSVSFLVFLLGSVLLFFLMIWVWYFGMIWLVVFGWILFVVEEMKMWIILVVLILLIKWILVLLKNVLDVVVGRCLLVEIFLVRLERLCWFYNFIMVWYLVGVVKLVVILKCFMVLYRVLKLGWLGKVMVILVCVGKIRKVFSLKVKVRGGVFVKILFGCGWR